MILPDEPKSSHANGLQVGVSVSSQSMGSLLLSPHFVPAGDLKGCPEDLGSHELRHLDMSAEEAARYGRLREGVGEMGKV